MRPASASVQTSRAGRCSLKGRSQTAVVPLLRHQGEMDSCGKDASGNRQAQEMSLTQKLGPFVRTMVWNKPVVSIAYRKDVFYAPL